MAHVSIPGGGGSMLVFTVAGGAATNYANDFANAVAGLTPTFLPGGTESTVPGAFTIIDPLSSSLFTLSTGDQYTYADFGTPTTVVGSDAGGDTILGGALLTYDATGGDDKVVFTDGANTYNGSSVGGDTVVGGAGYDTINTGTGATTVFSGTGSTLINLNDTVPGDVVVLDAGNSTVNAMGISDTVFASATGTIFGGSGALTFVSETGSMPVTIVGGTGPTDMFATAGTNIVFANDVGGSLANFVAGGGNETLNGANAVGGFAFFGDTDTTASVSDTVVGGSGGDYFSTGAGTESFFAGSGAALFEINTVSGGATITISDFSAADSVNFAGLSVADETSLLGSSSTVTDGSLTVTLGDGTKVDFVGVTSLTGHLV